MSKTPWDDVVETSFGGRDPLEGVPHLKADGGPLTVEKLRRAVDALKAAELRPVPPIGPLFVPRSVLEFSTLAEVEEVARYFGFDGVAFEDEPRW